MKEFSATILEGMIHNLRTPLNLILAYAQQIQKQGDNLMAGKIYHSGIRMDDMMQETWEALQNRSPEIRDTELTNWLKQELRLLDCFLPIKHRISILAAYPEAELHVKVSSLSLALWLEELLQFVVMAIPDKSIELGISFTETGLDLHFVAENINFQLWEDELSKINHSLQSHKLITSLKESAMQIELSFL